MYSYVHRYHAGSFADIHKHISLIALLHHFVKKKTPFCVLDSHAGEGLYDLHSKESQKNHEYALGIEKLKVDHPLPALAKVLVDIIKKHNPAPLQNIYPGSSAIIEFFLREQDRAILIEHHPEAIVHLRKNFPNNKKIQIHDRDALEAMIALVPFPEKRGLIFIDPSYEVKSEYQRLVQTLKLSHFRFPSATYAVWYPLLPIAYHQEMLRKIQRCGFQKVWLCEWIPYPQHCTEGMYGSGIVIVNTPFELDSVLKTTFKALHQDSFLQGQFYQKWL